MATFTPVVRTQRKDGLFTVFIRLVHGSRPAYIMTDKTVSPQHVSKSGDITDPYVLAYCSKLILDWSDRLNRVNTSAWTVKQIADFLRTGEEVMPFSDYCRRHIERMVDDGHGRNAKSYRLALESLERHMGTNRITFAQLTSHAVAGWVRSLDGTHRAKEQYPVCVRQMFRAAVDELNDYDAGCIRITTNPWPKVKIPRADTPQKRAISAEECRAFFSAPLPESKMAAPLAELGRDVAKMVLCLAGINTADLYALQKTDLRDGVICYKRAKTRHSRADEAYIEMRVEPVLEQLMAEYATPPDDPYLLNFHTRFTTADSFNANANNGIKQVCRAMGLPREGWYSAYTFRHTWGTVAQNDVGATIAEVAFAMNHSHGHAVTRGYIKLDFTPAWELNAKVVDFVLFSNKPSKLHAKAESGEGRAESALFRLSPKMLVQAEAYFRGEVLASVHDIGFANIDEVITRLASQLPTTIPQRSAVQFRIANCDTGRTAVYERTKGKGF